MIDQNELVRVFVKESQVHLESVESELLELQTNIDNIDLDVLNGIFRSIHSIKGASGFYRFGKIGELSYGMENLLSQLRYEKIKVDPKVIDALLTGRDALKNMLDDIGKSDEYDIKKELKLLTKYLKSENEPVRMVRVQEELGQGQQNKEFEISEEKLALFVKDGQSLYTLKLFLKKDLTQEGKTPFDLINAINTNGEFIESSLDIDNIQGIADCLENDLSFVVLFATDMKSDMIPGALNIAKDRVTAIDMKEDGIQKDTLFLESKTDLVASQIEKLRDSFLKKLKANPNVSKVVFKADHIETVDSLGVNLIIGIYRQVNSESKTFEITGAGEKFLKVANFFQLPALFNITGIP
ncbi:MAG: Hpt domain-containing protein [Thermodesulfobacteriota bacterium]|nr:Hpt domain-containing protein [Thermodesulfobacteriota bacterium]